MTLDLGIILRVATLVTVIGGLVFGVLEVRRARRVRADKGARDVLSIAVNPDHIEASYGILELPVGARSELVASSPELKRLANTLMVQYESLEIWSASESSHSIRYLEIRRFYALVYRDDEVKPVSQ